MEKKMRARLGFIKRWLKEAESDYAKDRKEEGEMHLLLVQAEARRALELSLADKAEKKKSSAPYFILPFLLIALGIAWLFFVSQDEALSNAPPAVQETEKRAEQVKEQVLPKENPPVKEIVTVKENNVPKTVKTVEDRSADKAVVNQPKEKIAVDMVDLVKEAEKNLYGKKEVGP
ncbi:MAG: hypothetical protein ACI3ZR_00500 [bacterium]